MEELERRMEQARAEKDIESYCFYADLQRKLERLTVIAKMIARLSQRRNVSDETLQTLFDETLQTLFDAIYDAGMLIEEEADV